MILYKIASRLKPHPHYQLSMYSLPFLFTLFVHVHLFQFLLVNVNAGAERIAGTSRAAIQEIEAVEASNIYSQTANRASVIQHINPLRSPAAGPAASARLAKVINSLIEDRREEALTIAAHLQTDSPNEAFRLAARYGYPQVIEYLLQDKRINPSDFGSYGLQVASRFGHTDIVELFLKDGRANPRADDDYAFKVATRHHQIGVLKLLLADPRGIDPTSNQQFHIQYASAYGHLDLVEQLLRDPRVDPSANDNYAIHMASENGYAEIVKVLLSDSRVDPSQNDNVALRIAAKKGRVKVVELLLRDARVEPSASSNFAIRYAARGNHVDVVRALLLDARVDPSANHNEALEWAVDRGHGQVVDALIDSGRLTFPPTPGIEMKGSTFLENMSEECSVCFENGGEGLSTPCSHLFHQNCLKTWFLAKMQANQLLSCPSCRADLGPATNTRTVAPARFSIQRHGSGSNPPSPASPARSASPSRFSFEGSEY